MYTAIVQTVPSSSSSRLRLPPSILLTSAPSNISSCMFVVSAFSISCVLLIALVSPSHSLFYLLLRKPPGTLVSK